MRKKLNEPPYTSKVKLGLFFYDKVTIRISFEKFNNGYQQQKGCWAGRKSKSKL